MIATGHNGVGALIGVTVLSLQEGYDLQGLELYLLALFLGIVSHYLADSIPHGHIFGFAIQKRLKEIILIDLFSSFLLIAIISYSKFGLSESFLVIMVSILGAQLPDVIGGLEFIGRVRIRGFLLLEYKLHQYIAHWHGYEVNGLPWRQRDIWQILIYFLSLYVVWVY